ncbi:MAG: hypothetical protein J6M53_01205 [Bacteroidaceae bacterium]|nr:hypothetical protein [Bacteroidaceae bacterium]
MKRILSNLLTKLPPRRGRVGVGFFFLLCSLPSFAQDAFYVYRNDADFNGFFFDQVARMGYSKVDLDSVEHDVYVIQEIETTDSLYRIPLAAIDSIGFQQPEIRFNPQLRMMDELGMTAYVASSSMDAAAETGRIAFTSALPTGLKPSVGDVLAGFDESVYGEGSFLGRVTAVRTEGGQTVCDCAFVSDWAELFDQVITVEQIGTDAQGNVRRRVAGFNPDGSLRNGVARRAGSNYDLTIFDWSGRIQKELYHSDAESVNVGVNLGFNATCSAVYNISGVFDKHVFLKLVFRQAFSAGANIQASLSGGHEWPIPTPLDLIPAVKFPAFFPIFQCDPKPTGFFRIGGEAKVTLDLPKAEFGFSQTFVYDNKAEDSWTFTWGNLDKDDSAPVVDADGSLMGLGMSFSGYAQIGAKSNIRLENNSWLSKLLEFAIGLEIYAGPKVEGSVNLDLTGGYDNTYVYLKDSYLDFTTFSFDRELKYKWRVGTKKEERTLWSDTQKAGSVTWYLLPNFLDTQAEVDKAAKQVRATVFPRRNVFATSEIGIGAIDESGEAPNLILFRYGKKYGFSERFNEYSNAFPFSYFPRAGRYKIAPIMKIFGETLAAFEEGVDVDIPPYIDVSTDTLTFQSDLANNEPQTVTVETNGEGVFYYLQAQISSDDTNWGGRYPEDVDNLSSDSWLDVSHSVSITGERRLVVKALQSNDLSVVDRHARLIIVASGGGEILRDTINITQLGTTRLPRGTKLTFSLGGNVQSVHTRTETYVGSDTPNKSETTTTTVDSDIRGEVIHGLTNMPDADNFYTFSLISLRREGNLLYATGRLSGSEESKADDESAGYNRVTYTEENRSTEMKLSVVFDVSWYTPFVLEGNVKTSVESKQSRRSLNKAYGWVYINQNTSSEITEGSFRVSWKDSSDMTVTYGREYSEWSNDIVKTKVTEWHESDDQQNSSTTIREEDVMSNPAAAPYVYLTLPADDSEWIYD